MERLKHIKDTLIGCVQTELGDLRNVDTKELGEVVDMIKDIDEAMYYCSIVEAMEEKEKEGRTREHYYYTPYYLPPEREYYYIPERDMDRDYFGRMYYSEQRDSQGRFTEGNTMGRRNYYNGGGSGSSSGSGGSRDGNSGGSSGGSGRGGSRQYSEMEFPMELRDYREGRSPMSRRMYMESKELHKDKNVKMQELERYMKELSEDLVEMIEDASPEEKQMLEKKVTSLATKVASLNNG